MRAFKILISVALLATCAVTAYRIPYSRLRCEREKKAIEALIRRSESMSIFTRSATLRQVIARCDRCLALDRADFDFYILRGGAEAFLGQTDRALRTYRLALSLNERPEIYANIGLINLEEGRYAEGKDALITASVFNLTYCETVDVPLRGEIYAAVMERQDRLRRRAAERVR